MKKYIRLSCSVCRRVADRQIDNVRTTPDKCDITFACEGRLFPIAYTSNPGITSNPEIGVLDWRQRGSSQVESQGPAETLLIDTSTGTNQQLVIGILGPTSPTLTLSLLQKVETPRSYRQFVFRRENSFDSISGVESGLEKKTLRYSQTDSVEVFLNGIKVQQSIGALDPLADLSYAVNDGSANPQVAPNIIKFNKDIVLPGIIQLDVIVSPTVAQTFVSIQLTRMTDNEARRNSGAWENVDSASIIGNLGLSQYNLFYCDVNDATTLQPNTVLIANAIYDGVLTIPLTSSILLLARKPYSRLDRYLTLSAKLSGMTFDQKYFKCEVINGVKTLRITEASILQQFPAMKANKFQIESTIKTAIAGTAEQVTIDNAVVVGPDV